MLRSRADTARLRTVLVRSAQPTGGRHSLGAIPVYTAISVSEAPIVLFWPANDCT
jgi:hypothetical protein